MDRAVIWITRGRTHIRECHTLVLHSLRDGRGILISAPANQARCLLYSPFMARRSAVRASSRVESSAGREELLSLMISGISVQPGTTASHPASFSREITRW